MSRGDYVRTRNWSTIVYPESAPENWKEILEDFKVPAFISPLHDLDINPTGEIKKPHYHVVIMFEGVKTVEQAQELFSKIGGVGHERVNSIRGMARYLCHLDNPDKHRYSESDVISLCGADYFGTVSLVTDKYQAIGDIIDYCEQNDIISYWELITYCRQQRPDWFRTLCDNGTYVIKEYLKSRQWHMGMVHND